MVKMKILSSLTVLQVQLISQPLQKQQNAGQQEETEETEEFELSPEEETSAVSDIDVTFE